MRTALVFAGLVGAVAVAAPVPKEVKAKRTDAEVFVGAWEIVRSEVNGKPRGGDLTTWTFDTDLKMKSVPAGARPGSESTWVIKIDPEKTPKEIDITGYKGIYEFDGGDIRIAYTLGGNRPTTFDPQPDVYFELLRRVPDKGK